MLRNDVVTGYLSELLYKWTIEEELKSLPIYTNIKKIAMNSASGNKVLITRSGPSVNLKVIGEHCQLSFDCDFLLSLPVYGWPSPANEWKIRNRRWPDQQTVEWLSSLPCHLIAKPVHKSDFDGWRYSFIRQELELSNMLCPDARLCYIALKFIFKKHLKFIASGLKSYHMLTLFFWFNEQQHPQFWTDGING